MKAARLGSLFSLLASYLMVEPAASLPLKIAHVFLKRKNSLRSDSLRFYTENFPVFFNAAEKNAGSTIKHSFSRKERILSQ